MTFDERFETSASPELAFPYLANLNNAPAWDPSIPKVEQIIPGPVGLGTRFFVTVRMFGITNVFEYHVETWEPDRRAVLLGRGTTATATDTIVVTHHGGGSRVQWTVEVHLRGPLHLVEPVAAVFFKFNVRRAIANLKQKLDQLA
ncbi:MAG TPA: SRPBCC family protein [Candidatus Binatia bacterium]